MLDASDKRRATKYLRAQIKRLLSKKLLKSRKVAGKVVISPYVRSGERIKDGNSKLTRRRSIQQDGDGGVVN